MIYFPYIYVAKHLTEKKKKHFLKWKKGFVVEGLSSFFFRKTIFHGLRKYRD